MEAFQKKIVATSRDIKYAYYVSPPGAATSEQPALLFVHGFPDSAHLWTGVIAALGSLPNKIIVPDCLGYAGTDKPEDTKLYAYKDQAADLVDILANEKAKSTIIIGHDWGSALAQRTYLYYRELFCGVVLLNTGYMVPSDQPFDLTAVNEYTTKTLGYPQFSYWEFFTAPDAAKIVDDNLDRMWQVLHGDVDDWMKKMFCVPNAMRNFMLSDEEVPLKSYAGKPEWRNRFMEQFKKDGFASALQMYKATASNVQSLSDAGIPEAAWTIEAPLLFVLCTKDAVCVPEMMAPAKTQGLVPKLKEVVIECAHWSPMEKPEEIARHIRDFVIEICQ
ncbi:epoxide hydrolase [Thozetella sp. PMI_491]|nr:epoxide hydrolase [Thozetella sp. PMI_491]